MQNPDEKALHDIYLLVRDLAHPRAWIYWTDLLLTSLIAWSTLLWGGTLAWSSPLTYLTLTLSILAFYRGVLFIHELAHLKPHQVRGFFWVWNLLIGIPLLVPAFFYVRIHLVHHQRAIYGTPQDPEYLPLSDEGFLRILFFLIHPAFAPFALFFRFAILSPLSVVSKKIKSFSVGKMSTLLIDPSFTRPFPKGAEKRTWIFLEICCAVWALTFLALVFTHRISLHFLSFALAMGSGVAVINQARTLLAHRFTNRQGNALSIREQFLDSVNFSTQSVFTELWAPLGLRYHALHHFIPTLPYHSLALAHQRLSKELPPDSFYHQATYSGFLPALQELYLSERRI